jgi:FkbM family methyltransferase
MITKGTLYSAAESITPPIIFRTLKRSALYPWLVKTVSRATTQRKPEVVTITGGDLAGYKMKVDPSGPWQQEMIQGTYDKELFAILKPLITHPDTVMYDIGAHICFHSLAFAHDVGPTGHVYAFEPNPANVARAREIIDLNPELAKRITLLHTALSDHNGTTTFLSTDDVEGGTSTGGFIDDAATLWERERYVEKVGFKAAPVALATIDSLIKDGTIKPPHILKIDVEGAEQLVLAGARETLATHHPTIIIEFHSIYSAYSCMEQLNTHHYTTTVLKQEPDGRVMILAK